MIDVLNTYLPIFIYILLCILIVLLIIICFKAIKTMNKVEEITKDVEDKVKSLNGVFNIVDSVTDKLSALTEVISDSIILFVKGIFQRKNNKKKEKLRKEIEDEDLECDCTCRDDGSCRMWGRFVFIFN